MPPRDKAPREDSRLSQPDLGNLAGRRGNSSQQQLLTRNVSERVVDKDNHNHLRDCLKYLVLSLPAPTQTPLEVRLAAMVKWHPESLTGEPRKAEDGPTWSASAN
jgi:hypothetical protein